MEVLLIVHSVGDDGIVRPRTVGWCSNFARAEYVLNSMFGLKVREQDKNNMEVRYSEGKNFFAELRKVEEL